MVFSGVEKIRSVLSVEDDHFCTHAPDEVSEHTLKRVGALKPPSGVSKTKWRSFIISFLHSETNDYSSLLESHAKKKETFNADMFCVVPVVVTHEYDFRFKRPYGKRADTVYEWKSKWSMYIDSPHAFVLLYKIGEETKDTPECWEPISVASFNPHFKSRTLLIDQLQGGSTFRGDTTNRARGARMKFDVSPEHILFKVTKRFAQEIGMKKIGLRKPENNKWTKVNTCTSGKAYQTVATDEGMKATPRSEYFYKDI